MGDFEALLDTTDLMSNTGGQGTAGTPQEEIPIDLDSFHADLEFRKRSAELESFVQKVREAYILGNLNLQLDRIASMSKNGSTLSITRTDFLVKNRLAREKHHL